MEDFKTIIGSMDLPNQLKDYLNNRKEMQDILTQDTLKEVEELYIMYRSLYFFDTTEFSLYSIIVLKKSPQLDSVFYYLRKVINTELLLTSKGDEENYILVESTLFEKIVQSSATFFANFNNEINNKDDFDLKQAYVNLGKLELINEIVKDEDWNYLYITARGLLEDSSF